MTLDYNLIRSSGEPLDDDSVAQVRVAGATLAYYAAVHSNDPEQLGALFRATITGAPAVYGRIFTAAFEVVVTEILQPALAVAAKHGVDLRPVLGDIAATRRDRGEQ